MALLKFAGIPRSIFYHYLKKMKNPDKYKEVKAVIHEIYYVSKGDMAIDESPWSCIIEDIALTIRRF